MKLAMDHYLFILFSKIYDLQTNAGMVPEGGYSTTLFTSFNLGGPALFLVVKLMGVAHKLGYASRRTHCAEISRQQMAVEGTINHTLNDSPQATSEAVVHSVTNLACYGAAWSEPEQYATHVTGLKQMLHYMGGSLALGVFEILHISLPWSDVTCEYVLETTLSFAEHDLADPVVESCCSGLPKGELHCNW
ncbi:hypothetical protein DOTSEDRAFT_71606 [Dothistroma septosporum NZE10]|uniref:Uncharacterized protein n=1 Tax=Dothistroma septosporum (strain NZE10 / CBS 128990) TaxID=675120 RepID=N1PN73_DOTSN|nr:hypothetical protein DOTSEDRAFT_71606 [Dothistroma septosporum NZE10]